MSRLARFRLLAGWALVSTLVAGAGTQHNHSLLSELLESSSPATASERFATTHEDDAASPVHWDRIVRTQGEGCVSCHAQRAANLAKPAQPGAVLEPREELRCDPPTASVSVSRLADSCRAPPSLL